MATSRRKKILVALRMAGVAGQDKLAGIFRYLTEKYGESVPCDIQLVRTKAEFSPELLREAIDAGTDAFIVSIPETENTARLLADVDTPTIVMDIPAEPLGGRTRNLVFIRNSSDEIGREAARYFIGQGVARSYAFLHSVGSDGAPVDWSVSRCNAFRETLRDSGLWCTEIFGPDEAAKLKRPAAVLAANDDCAFKLVERLRSRRLRIPQDVAVLGVDNDALLCENSHPRLSSVQPDFEREGYMAAKTIDEMLGGKAPEEHIVFVGVKSVVRRESTAELSHAGRLVQKAVAFIDRNATKGIGVRDVVAHLKCSRRLADLRFRELQGRTILEAITERRLDEVKHMLLATNDRMDEIASVCGYPNSTYLKNLFKKRFSMSMSDFRRQGRTT
jgi:DNA-binding LacI/PurR family transcriptional regulator